MDLQLKDKRVLITGSSRGIGLTIALAFAREGAQPILVARDRSNLDKAEQAFAQAQRIIASMLGYLSHELGHCMERPQDYVLLVRWATLTDHEVGFRQSAQYQEWKRLLHHFYDPFPTVVHFEPVTPDRV